MVLNQEALDIAEKAYCDAYEARETAYFDAMQDGVVDYNYSGINPVSAAIIAYLEALEILT